MRHLPPVWPAIIVPMILPMILLGVAAPWGAAQAARDGLEARVERLERLLESRNLVDLVMQMQSLQEEVQRLRGQLEVQQHRLDQLVRQRGEVQMGGEGRGAERPTEEPAVTPPPPPAAVAPGAPGPAEAPRPPGPLTAGSEEKAQYESALTQLQERQYEQAAATLRAFLERYPQSPYLPNVWYWLGEAQYVQRRLPEALEAFQKVRQDYPDSAKVPDALLKIGTILDEQGQPEQARDVLNDLIDRYPRSSAAYLAQKRLQGRAPGK